MPALHLKRRERGSVPASRISRAIFKSCQPNARVKTKTASFGKWTLSLRPHEKNILSSGLLRLSERQRLQELLLALKTRLARPSPQPLRVGSPRHVGARSRRRRLLFSQCDSAPRDSGDPSKSALRAGRSGRVSSPRSKCWHFTISLKSSRAVGSSWTA